MKRPTYHRAVAVVFADAPGRDRRDAANRLTVTVAQTLGSRLPTFTCGGKTGPAIEVRDVVDLAVAMSTQYVHFTPTADHFTPTDLAQGQRPAGSTAVYRVAALVFADAPGADVHDATDQLVDAVDDTLPDLIPTPTRGGGSYPDIEVHNVVNLAASTYPKCLAVSPAAYLPQERPGG